MNNRDAEHSAATPALPELRTLWNYQDPAGTEGKFREVLPRAEASGDLGYLLELQTQIARTYSLRRMFDEAHALLDAVEPRLKPELKRARVRYLLERGRAFNSAGVKDKALALFKEAWDVARDAGEEALALDAAHMVAIAAEPDEALEWSRMAIELAETSADENVKAWLGPLYNNTGFTYLDRGDFDNAMILFRKGYDFRLRKGWTRETVIALWTLGHTQRKMGDPAAGLATQLDVEKRWRQIGEEPSGYTDEERGECLLALGKPDEAQPCFAATWRKLHTDEWLQAEEPDRLTRLKQLGGVDE